MATYCMLAPNSWPICSLKAFASSGLISKAVSLSVRLYRGALSASELAFLENRLRFGLEHRSDNLHLPAGARQDIARAGNQHVRREPGQLVEAIAPDAEHEPAD